MTEALPGVEEFQALVSRISQDQVSSVELTVLLPCLNEAETLAKCIAKAQVAIQKHELHAEILISDNGSTDGSQEIAERAGARVIHVPERGYGAALIAGVAAARGTYVIMADSDDSYDLSSLMDFLAKLQRGLRLGHRKPIPGRNCRGRDAIPASLSRNSSSNVSFPHVFSYALWRCELRHARIPPGRGPAAGLALPRHGIRERNAGEVFVVWIADGRGSHDARARSEQQRKPHLCRTLARQWLRHLRFLLMYSPRWLFLYPGILLVLAGLAGCVRLLPRPRVPSWNRF